MEKQTKNSAVYTQIYMILHLTNNASVHLSVIVSMVVLYYPRIHVGKCIIESSDLGWVDFDIDSTENCTAC